jgi:dUTP pyrophosphatase
MASDRKFEKPFTTADMANEIARDFGGGDAAVDHALPTPERVEQAQYITRVPVRVKTLPSYEGLPLLSLATIGSAGVDLFCALRDKVCLNSMGTREIIPTGISIELPIGYEAQIRPRSGLAAKYGITVLNSPGTIDSDYRGEIGIILVNLSKTRFFVERGMRIAQMVIKPTVVPVIEYVDELDMTGRGSDGFGSTGQ